MARVGMGAVVLLLLVAGCSSAEPETGPKPDADGFYPTDGALAPRSEIANAPIFIEPAKLVLGVGEQAQVRAFELDLDGLRVPVAVTWAPPPSVGMNAQDELIGVEVGAGVVRAFGSSNREAIAEVEVVAAPVAGPQSLRFEPAALSIGEGELLPFSYEVLDGLGNPLPGTAVEWVVAGSGVAIEGDQIRGVGPGLALIQAKLPGAGEPLAGQLIVSVGAQQPASCEEYEAVTGCFMVAPPYLFTGPGAADEVVVGVGYAQYGTDCNRLPWFDLRLEHPTHVTVKHPKVVNVSGGLLAGTGPGQTVYRAYVGDHLCGQPGATVTPDFGGDWAFECSNGATGSMSVEGWALSTYHHIGALATGAIVAKSDFPLLLPFTIDSCASKPECSASVDAAWNGHIGSCVGPVPREGECTGENPCCGLPGHVCEGAAGDQALEVIGPDELRSGSCKFVRGGGSCGGVPPGGEGCNFDADCSAGICNTGYAGQNDWGQLTDGTCRPLSKDGEKCRGAEDCEAGLYCEFDPPLAYCVSTTVRGTCAPRKPSGSACECNPACSSGSCSGGVCD
jgi:hypothetical protein